MSLFPGHYKESLNEAESSSVLRLGKIYAQTLMQPRRTGWHWGALPGIPI